MLDFVVDLIGGAGFGTLIGALGGAYSRYEERKSLELTLSHQESMAKHNTAHVEALASLQISEQEIRGRNEASRLDGQAFVESQKTRTDFSGGVKAIVRPLILIALMIHAYLIYGSLEELSGGISAIAPQEALELLKLVVITSLSLLSTGVSWYFSQRSSKQFDKIITRFTQS